MLPGSHAQAYHLLTQVLVVGSQGKMLSQAVQGMLPLTQCYFASPKPYPIGAGGGQPRDECSVLKQTVCRAMPVTSATVLS